MYLKSRTLGARLNLGTLLGTCPGSGTPSSALFKTVTRPKQAETWPLSLSRGPFRPLFRAWSSPEARVCTS
eukprot:12963769-Alexandrium_andersonii.AAC.1